MKNGKLRDRMKVILAVICVLAAGICYIGSRYVRPEENRVREEQFVLDTEEEDTFLTDEGDTRKQDDSMSESRKDRDAGVGSQDSGKTQQPCGEETKTQGSSKAREESVFVHVCGEVVFPGVFRFRTGRRQSVFQNSSLGWEPEFQAARQPRLDPDRARQPGR